MADIPVVPEPNTYVTGQPTIAVPTGLQPTQQVKPPADIEPPKATRNVRNNNPGNIKKLGKWGEWQGVAKDQDDPTFVKFSTPEYGLRAMARILGNYKTKHGIDTVKGMVERWSATDQKSYTASMAKALGVKPTDKIDIDKLLPQIMASIIHTEGGSSPYTQEQINAGIRMADPSWSPGDGTGVVEETDAPKPVTPMTAAPSVDDVQSTGDRLTVPETIQATPRSYEPAEEVEKPSYFSLLSQGFTENTLYGSFLKTEESRRYGEVWAPDFDPVKAVDDSGVSERFSTEEVSRLRHEAQNQPHLDALITELDESHKYSEQLAAAGVVSSLTSAGISSLLSPELFLFGAAEAKAVAFGWKGALAAASASNVAQEVLIDHLVKNRTGSDFMMAAATPIALGGVGALGMKAITGSADISKAFGAVVEEAKHRRVSEAVAEIEGAETAGVHTGFGPGSSGAATAKGSALRKKQQRSWAQTTLGSDYSAFTQWGGLAHEYMDKFLSDPVGTGGKTARKVSAALTRVRTERQLLQEVMPTIEKSMIEYKRTYRGPDAQQAFNKELHAELGYRQFGDHMSENPAIIAAADAYEAARKLEWQLGTKHGIEKFEGVTDPKSSYMEQVWNKAKLHELRQLGKEEQVIRLIKKGVIEGNMREIAPDEKAAEAVAKAIVRRMVSMHESINVDAQRVVPREARKFVEEVLKDTDLDDVQKETIRKALNPDQNKKVTVLDMHAYSDELDMTVQDLLDTNVVAHVHRDLQESSGWIAYATQGIKSQEQWDDMRDAIIKEQMALNPGPDSQKTATRLANMMDMHHKVMLGKPTEDNPMGLGSTILRRLRETTGLIALNQQGFAQASESARIMASQGISGMFKDAPTLKGIVGLKGPELDEFLKDIQDSGFGGIGNWHYLNPRNMRTDDYADFDGTMSALGKRYDEFLGKARKWQGKYTGMDSIMANQEAMAIRTICNKMYREATGQTTLGETFRKRLRDMTLDDKTIDRVFDVMRSKAVRAEDGTAKTLDVSSWDKDLRESFFNALEQHVHQVIQKDLVGEGQWWWGNALAKSLGQFRKFPTIAMEKQLLHDVRLGDAESVGALMYGIGLSSALYYARTKMNSIGRPDSEQYMKDRMSGANLATGVFSYVGSAAMLPEICRTSSQIMFGSVTPMRNGGAPMTSLPDKTMRGLMGLRKVINPFEDAEFKDFNDAVGMTGANKIVGLNVVFNLMGNAVDKL